jgi:hypothetical protein
VKLYHGTSSVSLKMIMEKGIRPRGKRRSLWKEHPSAIDRVYLTRAYAVYFACHAAKEHKSNAVVIEVDVDEANLVPDEDALAQVKISDEEFLFLNKLDLAERTRYWKEAAPIYPELWQKSIEWLGNCAHMGTIPASQITRYVEFEPTLEIMLGHDPVISISNYKFMGEQYVRCLGQFVESGGKEGRRVQHPAAEKLFAELREKMQKGT